MDAHTTTKTLTDARALVACNKLLRALNRPQTLERTAAGCRLVEKVRAGNGFSKRVAQAAVAVHTLLSELSALPIPVKDGEKPIKLPIAAYKAPMRPPEPETLEDRITWHILDLEKHARRKAGGRDPKSIATETAQRALQTLRNNPGAFDPHKGDLLQWLQFIQGHVIVDHSRRDDKHPSAGNNAVKLNPLERDRKQREKMLAGLTADERAAFLAIEGERLTYAATAERLQMTAMRVQELVSAAKSKIHARERTVTTRDETSASDIGQPDHVVDAIALEAAFETLSEREQTAFAAVRVEGLSYEQAAREQGVKVGTLASRVAAADSKMAEHLSPLPSADVVETKARQADELAPDFAPIAHEVIDTEIPDTSGHIDYDVAAGFDHDVGLHRNDWTRGDYHEQF